MQRDLATLIADLYDRARTNPTSKNAVLVTIQLVADQLKLMTTGDVALDGAMTAYTPPFQLTPVGGSGHPKLVLGMGQLR